MNAIYLVIISAVLEFLKLLRLSSSLNCTGRGMKGTVCCAGYVWNNNLGNCTPCNVGYHGPYCSDPCPYPSFGKDCQSLCNCSEFKCDYQLGCRQNPEDCGLGYYGHFCEKRCRYPNFGNKCQHYCNCEQDMCHFVKGCNNTMTSSFTADIPSSVRPSVNSSVLINIEIGDISLGNNAFPAKSTIRDKVSVEHTNHNTVKLDFNRSVLSTTRTISPMAAGIIGLGVVGALLLFIYVGTFLLRDNNRNITSSMEI